MRETISCKSCGVYCQKRYKNLCSKCHKKLKIKNVFFDGLIIGVIIGMIWVSFIWVITTGGF